MTPSNANTSGLAAETRLKEIAAAIEFGSGNGISFREEGAVTLASDIRTVLFTAASAQARIAELEADVAALIRRRDDLLDTTNRYQARYRAAEARADRLAKVLRGLRDSCVRTPVGAGDGGTFIVSPPTREALSEANAALQQEG